MGDGSPSSGTSAALPHGTQHGDLSSIPLPLQDFQHLHPLRPHARAVIDYVGTIHKRKTVSVIFDPGFREWIHADEEGRRLGRQMATTIGREDIMGLTVTHRD